MEFNVKLQELRKRKNLTQEELAQALHVSRAAISKWESGRGYPGIDSLKAIADFFSVTVDALLSCNEVLTIAVEDRKDKQMHLRDLVFGLLDLSALAFFFIPLFGVKVADSVQTASLINLHGIPAYLLGTYLAVVSAMVLFGVFTLALQNWKLPAWINYKYILSLLINAAAALLFIITQQPYAATFTFIFLTIKTIMLIKKQ